MALPTPTDPRPHLVPSQPFAERLYFVPLLLPRLLPEDAPPDSEFSLEPRTDAPNLRNLKPSQLWLQPSVVSSVVRAIGITHLSSELRTLKRLKQVDPDSILPATARANFQSLLREYDSDLTLSFHVAMYPQVLTNQRSTWAPSIPLQRKGRLPQYAHDKLLELQEKFDHLEQLGVFQHPEDVVITVKYLNPSFLVKKAQQRSLSCHCFC